MCSIRQRVVLLRLLIIALAAAEAAVSCQPRNMPLSFESISND